MGLTASPFRGWSQLTRGRAVTGITLECDRSHSDRCHLALNVLPVRFPFRRELGVFVTGKPLKQEHPEVELVARKPERI
jgi:hypothetical protein